MTHGQAALAFLGAISVTMTNFSSTSCTRAVDGQGTTYHCPMHPTFVSNRQGDCPICGMTLVRVAKETSHEPPAPRPSGSDKATISAADGTGKYVCPMEECGIVSAEPGRCPKCGMDLVPAPPSAGGLSDMAAVVASSEGLRILGVKTAAATRGRLDRTIRAVGHVTADESRIHRVHTKVAGFIERLFVNQTGQSVRKGQPLLSLYSPELLASQEEFLRALDAARRFADSSLPEVRRAGQDLLAAARRRLELFDVPSSFIRSLERTGRPQRTVTLLAPASGVVTLKEAFEGQRIEPSTEIMTITDLSRVWVFVDLYEDEARGVFLGQPATFTLSYDPSVRIAGRVAFIYPTLNPDTRTLKVRLEFANPDGRLRPGGLANVEIAIESMEGLLVPDTAIMDTGEREIVFIAANGQRFVPRRVTVGLRSQGQAVVTEGLREGERVVTTAAFLLDSESRIRSAVLEQSEVKAAPACHEGH